MFRVHMLIFLLFLTAFVPLCHAADNPQEPRDNVPQIPTGLPPLEGQPQNPPRGISVIDKQQREKRYREMKRDSEKLLQLSTELKQYVDKADDNILSLEVVRKAEEIEKLARDVKKRMRGD